MLGTPQGTVFGVPVDIQGLAQLIIDSDPTARRTWISQSFAMLTGFIAIIFVTNAIEKEWLVCWPLAWRYGLEWLATDASSGAVAGHHLSQLLDFRMPGPLPILDVHSRVGESGIRRRPRHLVPADHWHETSLGEENRIPMQRSRWTESRMQKDHGSEQSGGETTKNCEPSIPTRDVDPNPLNLHVSGSRHVGHGPDLHR
jgi:hypothetical protein